MADKLKMYAQQLLRLVMREYSEEFYCAGWLTGIEYDLWAYVVGDIDKINSWGRLLDEEDRTRLQELANDSGGWYYWSPEPGHGEQFIAMADWLKMYEEYRSEDN